MLSTQALEILNQLTYLDSAFVACLPPDQLERSLYEEVNEALVRCGGKWKKGKGHVFPYDPKPLIEAVIETGQMPPKNPTAFFPTPRKIVDWMVDFSGLSHFGDGSRILEPSGGTGGILDVLRENAAEWGYEWQIDTCEFLDINRSLLQTKGYNVVANDFIEYQPNFEYDAILMNPPFSLDVDKKAYITHCMHAWSMLKEGGGFAAIVPPGFTYAQDTKSKEFLKFVCDNLEWEPVDRGEFKESGTMIATMIIYGEKRGAGWRREPHNGWPSWMSWHASLLLDNRQQFSDRLNNVKDFESFESLCAEAQASLIKEGIAMWLQPEDIQALWRYYKDDEEFMERITKGPIWISE